MLALYRVVWKCELEKKNCEELGSDLIIGVPSEGQRILTGGSPVMVEARAM